MSDESVIDEAFDAIFGLCQATIQHGECGDNVVVKLDSTVSFTMEYVGCVQPAASLGVTG